MKQLPETDLYPKQGWHLETIVNELKELRQAWRQEYNHLDLNNGHYFPSQEVLHHTVKTLAHVLFPLRLGPAHLNTETEDYYVGLKLDTALNSLFAQVKLELAYNYQFQSYSPDENFHLEIQAKQLVYDFAKTLPTIRKNLDLDVLAAFNGDPAARTVDEVLICYPGIKAILYHRIAHELYLKDLTLIARMIAELAHSETGIDIHPGATIDSGFFIDHGTGVVIGETSVIGKNVRLYQAVTLGAKSFPKNIDGSLQKGLPRHPVLEDDVVIYAGATVLGHVTIGQGSTIGSNVWLTHAVPPHSYITQSSH
ncbi:MAG: serine O-acetyltransferase EpsC [Thiofilum sp.]|uniref:serine O-acetyltransferase EpsC n=1 Tax=Thiofilum sp. TaxID=2212733 RepID=UPI0025EDBE0A|nr:serine O-acetyltransferase EpsC [Thiofilum sp.]MBK8454156.1 serine acetyltransferase [Thiofilum sp.]